jgi:hypothetical protein
MPSSLTFCVCRESFTTDYSAANVFCGERIDNPIKKTNKNFKLFVIAHPKIRYVCF